MKITESSLRKIIRKVIQEHYDFETPEGDILPDRMEEYSRYVKEIKFILEYFSNWPGLTYEFLSDQVSKQIKPFNPDMLERAVYGLISSEEVIEFKGMWNTMQDGAGSNTGTRVQRDLFKLAGD